MTDRRAIAAHYKDSAKLAVRGGFHARYSNISWFDWVDTRLNLPRGARVLDVGCGPGWFWEACTHLPDDMELTLVDQSANMVTEAIDRLAHLDIAGHVVADAMDLPFADQSFDVVTAKHVLYHVADAAGALQEIRRVLVPGGRCIVTTNSPRDLPQISELSRIAFGSAIGDVVQERFGTGVASTLMQELFEGITRQTYEDLYLVDDPGPVIDMLSTMPPGDKADAAGLARLTAAVDALMKAHDGVVPMPRVQDMFSGVRAGKTLIKAGA